MDEPDNKAALDFLRLWAPKGPWVLTAIQVDRKAITTTTFHRGDEDKITAWLEQYNGQRNIYFHVNPPLRDLDRKAQREDIKEMAWLHVDIDPRPREDVEEEQKRALELLTSKLPKGVPPPTVVIFSGGGYQGFWKLREPVPISGDLGKAEEAKRYNQQLELLFGGDNCHNLDRIMRLPGTINLPDAKKQKKGRKPTLAKLVSYQAGNIYPIEDFIPAAPVQSKGDSGFDAGISVGSVEYFDDINELDQWGVPDRVKVIVVQGKHPDEPPKKDDSRSSWLFDAVCNMLRHGVPEEVVYSVITNPEFSISDSVLEKGNSEKYALKQIRSAKDFIEEPWLDKLNRRHAVILNIGNKCRVAEEIIDPVLGRSTLSLQSFGDFRNRYLNFQVELGHDGKGNPLRRRVGDWWLENPRRRQYDTVVFAPGKEVPSSYNLWRGFACEARPGDCSLYLDHIRENICQGDEALNEYVLNWMARTVQKPDTPGGVAIVLRGGRGVGKSFFAKIFGSLFGRHFLQVSNPSHLVGNFNSHLRDAIVLFADEAFYAGDKKHVSILKTLITEDTLTIEAKGVDVETVPNYVHLIMASNDQHVIPAGGDERRFLVLDVGKEHQQSSEYFGAIAKQVESGGREALLHFLRTRPIDEFEVRNVPQTGALREQKLLSLQPDEEWWYTKLANGKLLDNHEQWEVEIPKKELVDDYISYTQRFMITRRGNETALGRFLLRVCPTMKKYQRIGDVETITDQGVVTRQRKRIQFYGFPSLQEARQHWEVLYGKTEWEDIDELPEKPRTKDIF